ncbi:hypothetical protein C8P68_1077 [Mucilaginibacter yixingensis]|uniref:Uncharacterized protein n=1 Tax=Mucilaginibacter yixingensis TaxID=1295612 RepID=A0A2T5J5X1_9SPHI|nr:hypothetical protein C8P68_1077 [Mucilaginibacter yixingensis]
MSEKIKFTKNHTLHFTLLLFCCGLLFFTGPINIFLNSVLVKPLISGYGKGLFNDYLLLFFSVALMLWLTKYGESRFFLMAAEIITREDLEVFKKDPINEIKKFLGNYKPVDSEWIRSSQVSDSGQHLCCFKMAVSVLTHLRVDRFTGLGIKAAKNIVRSINRHNFYFFCFLSRLRRPFSIFRRSERVAPLSAMANAIILLKWSM